MRSALLSLGLLLLLPSSRAEAAHDTIAAVQFLAFSADGNYFLIFVKDENRGPTLAVKAVGKQTSLLQIPTEGRPLEAFFKHPSLVPYRFVDGGVKGPDSPDGSIKLLGTPSAGAFELYMAAGGQMLKLFAIPLAKAPDSKLPATASLKEIAWSRSGQAAVIILNQRMSTSYGFDVDQVISFRSAPYRSKLAPGK